tara:strand:+ start:5526 stop:6662 length:1137 start_codon:yes stop_codon:yes gene_type:complete
MIYSVVIGEATSVELTTISDDVSLVFGRSDIYSDVCQSAARVTFYDADVSPYMKLLGYTLQVYSTASVLAFTGTISDMSLQVATPTSGNALTVTAIGRLSALGQKLIGSDVYPQETLEVRLDRIFADAGITAPFYVLELSSADLATSVVERSATESTALNVINELLSSVQAFVYDHPDGTIRIQSLAWRVESAGTNTVGADVVYSPTWTQSAQITNRVIVDYETGKIQKDDATSQERYGIRTGYLSTKLVSATDATTLATLTLNRQRRPRWNLRGIDVVQDDTEHYFSIGQKLYVSDLPTDSPAGSTGNYMGLVEGFSQAYRRGEQRTTVLITDPIFSGLALQWEDTLMPWIMTPYQWNTIRATVQWDDAITIEDLET